MALRSTGPFPDAVVAFVALSWLGVLLGVSFLATPVKFQAPSLELAAALEVGRVTFAALSKMEWGLSLLLIIATLYNQVSRAKVLLATVPIVIVAVQALWLLPVLDVRVEAVIVGQPMAPSLHHMIYAALEVVKVVGLATVGLAALFRLGWGVRPAEPPPSRV